MAETATVITVLSIVFGGVISLLIYIWNQTQKANEKRHEASEKRHEASELLISKLTETTVKMNTIIEYHEKQLDKIQ